MKVKSQIAIKGSKKKGYIISIWDNVGYMEDLSITWEEAVSLLKQLRSKLK